jgi:hypothetical protein
MRIEQIISRYSGQTFDHSGNKGESKRLFYKAKMQKTGCIDMLSITSEIENSNHTIKGLVTFVHLISNEAMKDWMQRAYCQPCSQEDVIVEKVLLEIW